MLTREQKRISNALMYNKAVFNAKLFREFKAALVKRGYDLQTIRDACYMAAGDGVFSR